MRHLLMLTMAVVACQDRSALQTAKPTDSGTLADASGLLPDSPGSPDQTGHADAPSCVPLLPIRLDELDPRVCPPTSAPAVCGGDDVGVIVARSNACTGAWGAIPYQCMGWPAIAPGQELVVLEVRSCLDDIEIQSARACDDHIEISSAEYLSCEACNGQRSALRAFLLPLDPRPVIDTRSLIASPCPPPPLTGGTTGSGGVSGTGGSAGASGVTSLGGAMGGGGTIGSGGSMSVCAIDGGYDCAKGPVNQITAGASYLGYVPGGSSSVAPGQSVGAVEKCVPGLWDVLQAQVFNGHVLAADGSILSECSFLLRGCTVTMIEPEADSCATFGPIISGVAAEGTFYYSYRVGSGIAYSVLGKLAWDGAELVRTQSPYYTNPSLGPPNLVVAAQGGRIVVYRAMVGWRAFNEWQAPAELMGTLVDFGDHLGITDSSGQELGSTLP